MSGVSRPVSCAPCSDSPLSTAVSVIGILTFIYALLVGLYVNTRYGAEAIKNSPQEFADLVDSLKQSLEEYQVFAERLSEWRGEDRVLASKAAQLADAADAALADLSHIVDGMGPESLYSNRKYWWWSTKFALAQKKLRKTVEKKNKIMEEIRVLQQDFYLKSQEKDLLRQHQILLDIQSRLHVVEAHQQVLGQAANIVFDAPPPATAFASAEDILASLMRPGRFSLDRTALTLAMNIRLPSETSSLKSQYIP